MLPDLGKYADAVLSAYGASIVLLVGLVVMSVVKGRRVRKQMQEIEARGEQNG
ncbi:MAG: heme exporter protein CcmD [Ascidiaceihabitans sp.]|jgi:heme exporter protein D|nr:heme exporter protein CcmD [Paracoccaceae bacterium]MDA9352065.1 heme exporter protein CcmD [Ascidiaceihabitans sp.]MDG1103168.1 heme exporter protein CcmD [Ascidiaceihabitans sp.]